MIGGRRDCAHTVGAGEQAGRDRGGKETLTVAVVVDTQEKGKSRWVRSSRWVQCADVLDSDVRVTDDIAIVIKLLWGGVVGRGGVRKVTSVQVLRLNLNIEGLVLLEGLSEARAHDDGRDHVGLGWNLTHGNRIARSINVLQTLGERLAIAEVDEVGIITGRRSATSLWHILEFTYVSDAA